MGKDLALTPEQADADARREAAMLLERLQRADDGRKMIIADADSPENYVIVTPISAMEFPRPRWSSLLRNFLKIRFRRRARGAMQPIGSGGEDRPRLGL